MKKKMFLILLLSIVSFCFSQQSSIGTLTPDASSAFEISSTTGGFLLPRMNQAQRDAIASPATGLLIFNTTRGCHEFYNGRVWVNMCSGGSIKIISQPVAPAITCAGTGIQKLTVAAIGSGLQYTWRRNGVTLINGGAISGQGTATLTLTNPVLSDAGNYEVIISDVFNAVSSYNVAVNVYSADITYVSGAEACVDNSVVLSAYAPGATIRWYDTAVGGAPLYTGAFFTTPVLTSTTTYYAEAVVSGCVTGLRRAVTAIVKNQPVVTTSGRTSYSSACGVTLSAISSSPDDEIIWYNTPVGGYEVGRGPTYTTPVLTTNTTYYVESINKYSCASVRVPAPVTIIPLDPSVVVSGTCKIWMAYNLGATAVANSSDDYTQFGSLFQWGRSADGHELTTYNSSSPTDASPVNGSISIPSSTDNPGHNLFIISSAVNFYNWRSPSVDNLWQGANGINNPCPAGFRVPTIIELVQERAFYNMNDDLGAYNNILKLVKGVYRERTGGYYPLGNYWSSTVAGNEAEALQVGGSVRPSTIERSRGAYVRCIKD